MNNQQRKGAEETLQLLGVQPPYTESECSKILKAHQQWHIQNSEITDLVQVRVRAERQTLGYLAAIEEAANEVKADRTTPNT